MKTLEDLTYQLTDGVLKYEELDFEARKYVLNDSLDYLLSEFPEFFSQEDLEVIYDFTLIDEILNQLADGERNVVGISELAEEQIIDEAIQYGIEHGY